MAKQINKIPHVVRCLVCDEPLKFPSYVAKNYKGQIRCQNCTSILHIKVSGPDIEEYLLVDDKAKEAITAKKYKELREALLKDKKSI